MRRISPYVVAATIVVVSAIVLFVLRRPAVSKQVTYHQADIEQPAQFQDRLQAATDDQPIPTPSRRATDGQTETQVADSRPTHYNSLPTGTSIAADIGVNGHGELTVGNGTSEDAVVRLFDPGNRTVRWFFVQAHTSARKGQIPPGNYRLAFTTGLNWVESRDAFSWHPAYNEFERPFEYGEQHDSEGFQYKKVSVTLNPVVFGNVRTKAITRKEFLKGHRHVALQR